ncbi:MAG TPA: hypothetical protein EYG03_13895 [Planctomycetes bacterium]|nr:hypothetical protein [Fuerstiella sp.]HIK93054.1 hypothetical protein [Planctomycetota bacterium]
MNHLFSILRILSSLFLGVGFLLQDTSAQTDGYNIIHIFADDMGYGEVGCFHKDSPFRNPRLDRMAKQGARLTSFSVPTP